MLIIVSACLLGRDCKYNGGNNLAPDLMTCLEGHALLPICPEERGGLPTPRPATERKDGHFVTKDGTLVDEYFGAGVEGTLQDLLDAGITTDQVDCAVLKSRSPSCGVNTIYDGSFSGVLILGMGAMAERLAAEGVQLFDSDDLDGLKKFLSNACGMPLCQIQDRDDE